MRRETALVRLGLVEHQDGEAVEDHVPADLGGQLREPQEQERAVAEDRGGAAFRRLGRRVDARVTRARPRGRGRTKPDEAPLHGAPLDEHAPAARGAAEAEVGAQAIHVPGPAAARVRAAELEAIAEPEGDGSGHARRGDVHRRRG